jgi:hypothetical protein
MVLRAAGLAAADLRAPACLPACLPSLAAQVLAGMLEEEERPGPLLELLMGALLPARREANPAAHKCAPCCSQQPLCSVPAAAWLPRATLAPAPPQSAVAAAAAAAGVGG